MIKDVEAVSCDMCGYTELLPQCVNDDNEPKHFVPDGWLYGARDGVHFCKECRAKPVIIWP